jgi:hypothetical protein
MFRQLQEDLNQYTRRHLDYFYRDILHFIPRPANPDKAFVIFEIQKQLEKYLLKKGLKIKGGKDDKKQEILFALDDEIVVNMAQVAESRTLFLDNRIIHDKTYMAGMYIAPNATMADGIDKPFRDDQPSNFPTLGSRESKYILPGSGVTKTYPNARTGFILTSDVLLLKEGTRTVTIRLKCHLDDAICNDIAAPLFPARDKCCDGNNQPEPGKKSVYPDFLPPDKLYADMITALNKYYYYINEDLVKELIKKGIGNDLISFLREVFLTRLNKSCYCESEIIKYESLIDAVEFEPLVGESNLKLISDVIKKRKPLKLLFSGEKEWIEPSEIKETTYQLSSLGSGNEFELTIEAVLNPDKPAVTFYNKENLKEDFDTTLPLVRIELDDHFKIPFQLKGEPNGEPCCLDKKNSEESVPVSLYHFFRNVKVIGKKGTNMADHSDETQISVKVCGLKNFIIQNDESVMDVNGLIMPFGSRPKIDSNFFIGSEEVFFKNWSNLYINLNWKDFPPIPTTGIFSGPNAENRRFQAYYNGYQDVFRNVAPSFTQGEILDSKFKTQFSFLFDGKWYDKTAPICEPANNNDLLFKKKPVVIPNPPNCNLEDFTHQFHILPGDFIAATKKHTEEITIGKLKKLEVDTRNFFLKMTLKCQDFQHDKYPIVLARQMAAFAKLPDLIDGAVYYGVITGNKIDQFSYDELTTVILQASGIAGGVVEPAVKGIVNEIINEWGLAAFYTVMWNIVFGGAVPSIPPPAPLPLPKSQFDSNLFKKAEELVKLLGDEAFKINNMKDKGVIIPREPWTPTLSKISLDYMADAYYEDINLIHLYPFAGTYKHEEIAQIPPLFPTFCDEGTLFLGLKDLVPGNNLNILFQLAESTSDSESEKEPVFWHFLDNNIWKQLRTGFEVLEDGTKNLTTSGIIKFALPENMTKENSVMPKGLHWIKASIIQNSRAVSEAISIHTQAVSVTFADDESNDQLRLVKPLSAESLSKLEIADTSIKSITQPYDTFGGAIPEIEKQFYVRVSEQLRHKGRAIQAFDYERLILQAFPQLFKVKCINHSFALNARQYSNDFPYAPGYVIAAVIPDLNQLGAGNSFEPKVPVSLIEEIDYYIRQRTSPFVRYRTMNPRYEKVNFCIRVQLVKGKDENYYSEKLRKDIAEFLAPWSVGMYDKLTFGQCIYRSDIVGFLERTDYVDFITDLRMGKDIPPADLPRVCPDTPRSILIAGDIDVCIESPGCETWKPYSSCEGEIIERCEIKPEIIMNYCK